MNEARSAGRRGNLKGMKLGNQRSYRSGGGKSMNKICDWNSFSERYFCCKWPSARRHEKKKSNSKIKSQNEWIKMSQDYCNNLKKILRRDIQKTKNTWKSTTTENSKQKIRNYAIKLDEWVIIMAFSQGLVDFIWKISFVRHSSNDNLHRKPNALFKSLPGLYRCFGTLSDNAFAQEPPRGIRWLAKTFCSSNWTHVRPTSENAPMSRDDVGFLCDSWSETPLIEAMRRASFWLALQCASNASTSIDSAPCNRTAVGLFHSTQDTISGRDPLYAWHRRSGSIQNCTLLRSARAAIRREKDGQTWGRTARHCSGCTTGCLPWQVVPVDRPDAAVHPDSSEQWRPSPGTSRRTLKATASVGRPSRRCFDTCDSALAHGASRSRSCHGRSHSSRTGFDRCCRDGTVAFAAALHSCWARQKSAE